MIIQEIIDARSSFLKVLVTGPSGVGKSHFSHSNFTNSVVHLDDYASNEDDLHIVREERISDIQAVLKDHISSGRPIPVLEGITSNLAQVVELLDINRIVILKPKIEVFRYYNYHKLLSVLENSKGDWNDYPISWAQYWFAHSKVRRRDFEKLFDSFKHNFLNHFDGSGSSVNRKVSFVDSFSKSNTLEICEFTPAIPDDLLKKAKDFDPKSLDPQIAGWFNTNSNV
jgi:hypothetical protein